MCIARHVAVAAFGMGSWLSVNSVFVQLPLFVNSVSLSVFVGRGLRECVSERFQILGVGKAGGRREGKTNFKKFVSHEEDYLHSRISNNYTSDCHRAFRTGAV